MNRIIESSLLTLEKSKTLLINLNDKQLSNTSVSPYYSSIGSHIRHIYDFYFCLFNLTKDDAVDLTLRKRNIDVESCCETAINYLISIEENFKKIKFKLDDSIKVIDDLGSGKIEINYTYGALLSQANSHTIHHYAIIGYLLDRLNIEINDKDFGYNPTTPKQVVNIN